MILQRLIMTDFRQYEKRNQIDFSNINNKHVSVVIASNGVGKTTILSALVWCLYGGKKLPYLDVPEQFLNNNTFGNLEEGEQATAEVVLIFEDRKSKYIITRSITVTKENLKHVNSSIALNVVIDNVTQHYAQEKIDTILGPSMKEFFFFDGEGIGKLADSSRPDLVQKGIKNVMKIDTRTKAFDLIKEAKKTFDKESAKIQTNSGITDIPEERIDEIDEQLILKKTALEKAIEDRDTFDKKLSALDKELMQIKETKPKVEERKRFEEELNKLKEDIIKANNKQKDLVTKHAYLALSSEALSNVSSILEEKQRRGELPLIGIGKHFIEELMKEHRCICGEELVEGGSHYKHLENIMKRATAKSELEGNLSSLGSFVEAHKNDNRDFISRLKDSRNNIKELQNKKSSLEQNIARITNEIDQWLDHDKEERLDLKRSETIISRDDKIKLVTQLEIEIEKLNSDLKKAKKDLELSESISTEVSLIRNRISFCEEAMSMLEEKNKEEIENIRIELSERLSKRFDSMLHSEKKAYLDESFKLVVIGTDGNVSGKSRGEAKLISLIFISTLIELAKEKEMSIESDYLSTGAGVYPIIVDSPYGEFDTEYKKTISNALKELAPQVIILLSNEQWSEDIESVFDDSLAHAYRLVAHRPKLRNLETKRNRLFFNRKTFDLETQDDREFTTIEKMEINNESV